MFSKIVRYFPVFENTIMNNDHCENSKSNGVANESESFNLLLNKPEAHALKSGHCMKEDCSICKALVNVEESQSSVVLPVTAKDCRELENDSNISLGICRICHCNTETLPELGPLQSVCNCRGTVALVHMTCLERWLAESDSSSCELCRYQYTVERIPKHGPFESVFVWINEVADFNQVRKDFLYFLTTLPLMSVLAAVALNTLTQLIMHCICNDKPASRYCSGISHVAICMAKIIYYNLKFKLIMDTIWFSLMTPLAAMAGYIFVRATSELIDDNFPTDAPWLMAALMLNSCLTLVAYYGWVMNSVKKHVSSWYRWWRTTDCIIKIQLPERPQPTVPTTTTEAIARQSTEILQANTLIQPEEKKSITNPIDTGNEQSSTSKSKPNGNSPSVGTNKKHDAIKKETSKMKIKVMGNVKKKEQKTSNTN